MTDKKISQLTGATTPLAGTEVLPIVQSSTTVKVAANDLTVKNIRSNATSGILQVAGPAAAATRVMTVPDANFTAARTDAANSFTDDQTLATGNLVIGTAGKGIDFSADPAAPGMTSELLDDYEEGTWTPTLAIPGGSVTVAYSKQVGRYVKIGKRVFFSAYVVTSTWTHSETVLGLAMSLPFTPNNSPHQTVAFNGSVNYTKANYTQVIPYIITEFFGSVIIFAATGSGQTWGDIVASDVPSGTNLILNVAGNYDA